MARDQEFQRNLWGAAGKESPNAQRADLWAMNLDIVVNGLNAQIRTDSETELQVIPDIQPYFVQSVTLPELKVNAEAFKRDSRPYMMPVHDEPLGAITLRFYLETPKNPQRSVVYQLMEAWRAYVRGGRGAYTAEAFVPKLGTNWRLNYAFDTYLTLYRGASAPQIVDYFAGVGQEHYGDKTLFMTQLDALKDDESKIKRLNALRTSAGLLDDLGLKNDLEKCGLIYLEKCWLSSFKFSDFNYAQGNNLVLIDAVLYADNIRDMTGATT